MTQDLQQLLEKIQRDGVDKAQAEADAAHKALTQAKTVKAVADKRVADAEAALKQAEAVKQAEENAKHAAQSGTTGSTTGAQTAQTGTQTGKTANGTPRFGAAKDAAKSGKRLAQTGVNAEATLGLMAVMAVAGAGCVLVKARGKHINRW